MQFKGTGSEYFDIWLVNIVLSILTLGIYSAWAKVRTERYFHANTELAGSHFEYLAKPIQILRGRLIAVGALVALSLAGELMPPLYFVLIIIFYGMLPIIIVRSLQFKARMTAWRGVRFSYHGEISRAYTLYLSLPVLVLLSLLLALPWLMRKQNDFVFNNLRFGSSRFSAGTGTAAFYKIFGIALLTSIVCFGIAGYLMSSTLSGMSEPEIESWMTGTGLFWMMGAYLIIVLFIYSYIQAATFKAVINGLKLDDHRFESKLSMATLLWIIISNFALMALTLGFGAPWTATRLAGYYARTTTLIAQGSLDDFVADKQADQSAIGEGMTDIFDIDVAL